MPTKSDKRQLRNAARRYLSAGYSPIPVLARKKVPAMKNWPKVRVREDEVNELFSEPGNVGLLLGKPSGNLVDIDLDAPEGGALADSFLPRTDMVHGRKSKPRSHRYYRTRNPPVSQKFSDVDGSCLLEIRSTGQQTIVPPSVHPSGERLRWEEQGPPARVKTTRLIRGAKLAAAATLLARHWPERGSRHESALALSGILLMAGWSVEKTKKFIKATARAGGDEEWKVREVDVNSTAKKLANIHPVTGARRLSELVGDKVVGLVYEWLKLSDRGSKTEHLTDLGNAGRFVSQHGKDIRFCHVWKKWLVFDGTRWVSDESGELERRAKATVRELYEEASRETDDVLRQKLGGWARTSESRGRIAAMTELAKSEPNIPVAPSELDANPWLVNCENGTIDLRTGKLRKHRADDLCTKLIPNVYDPSARCPKFKKFLWQILKNDVEVIKFLQRSVGYALTGSTSEQVLFILWGTGANGKSTWLEIIRTILGDYGRTADSALLMHRNHDGVRNDVARLAGARFVSTSETEAGRHLAEVLVKQLTGGDKVAARFLYSEFFEFDAQFKLFLTTNHKPVVRGTDNAIWRRIRLIPFEVTIPEEKQDKELPRKLRSELPGILAWAVRGCARWQRYGLGQPEKVLAATEAYREQMDVIGAFLKDRCVVRKDATVMSAELYATYKKWCEETGERPLTQNRLGMALEDRGFRAGRTRKKRFRWGLELRDMRDAVTHV